MATTYFRYPVVGGGGSPGSAVWGDITGTLSNQTDLQNALNLKAPIANPHFTGTALFGSFQAINADGSIGLGASDTSFNNQSAVFGDTATATGFRNVAIGYGAMASANNGVALGTGALADGYSIGILGNAGNASQSIAIGYQSQAGGADCLAIGYAAMAGANYSSAIGLGTSTTHLYSTVLGSDYSDSGNLNDSHAPGGITFGGYNPAGGVATGESWLGIVAGASANTPRVLLPAATTTDDTTSALQVTGPVSFNAKAFLANVDGSLGVGAVNGTDNTCVVIGNGSTLGGGSGTATVVGPSNIVDGANATCFGTQNTNSSQNSIAIGIGNTSGYTGTSAVGFGNTASNLYGQAFGAANSTAGQVSLAYGFTITNNGSNAGGFGSYMTISSTNSSVFGMGGSVGLLTDSFAPGGLTLGGMGPSADVAESWVGIVPGTAANTPRMLLGATVVDDMSSAFQPYGAIKLADFTTVTTPVKGQIAYNYTTGAITSYNGAAWV